MRSSSHDPGWEVLLTVNGQKLLQQVAARIRAGATLEHMSQELRTAGHSGDTVAALLTQATLRDTATQKFGELAHRLLFTRAGLAQASHRALSALHARRFVTAGISRVWDLGCGIGSESLAFLDAGLEVTAIELDTFTSQIAEHNLAQHDPERSRHRVLCADATTQHLGPTDGAFFDPARRTAGHRETRRLTNPADYRPSLHAVFDTASRHPTGVKLGPGLNHELIPPNAEAQWVSLGGSVLEVGLWFGALARERTSRSALVLTQSNKEITSAELHAPKPDAVAPVGELDTYVYEPDGAVIRAQLIGLLASQLEARVLDPHIAYLTAPTLRHTPFAQAFRVLEEVPTKEKALKRLLRERGIGRLEIKKRGVNVHPESLRQRLAPRGPHSAILMFFRVGQKHHALRVERVP